MREAVLVALTRKDEWRLRDDGWLSAGEVVIPFHVDLYNAAPNVKDDREIQQSVFSSLPDNGRKGDNMNIPLAYFLNSKENWD